MPESCRSLLWAVQAHFEISHEATLLSTIITEACKDVSKAKEFFSRYNRAIRTLKTADHTIWYHDILGEERRTSENIIGILKIFGFPDA